jgi:DNA-binding CsgD family transcriptional regulator
MARAYITRSGDDAPADVPHPEEDMQRRSMPRGWIRLQRAHALIQLGNEAREIAALDTRRQHMAAGLSQLVGTAALALITDVDFAPGRRGRIAAAAGVGQVQPIVEAHAQQPNEYNPVLRGLIASFDRVALGDVCVHPRVELVGDAGWRRSEYFNAYLRPARLEDCIYAARRTGPCSTDGAVLMRGRSERPFDEEDCALVELFLRTYGSLWSEGAGARAAWVEQLPQRLRRLVELLETGLSEKEIAARAQLSYASTHQYVVEIYRRAGVSSRAQLMARLLR